MGTPLPTYSLEEILTTLARNIIISGHFYDEDYKLLSAVADELYILKEDKDNE